MFVSASEFCRETKFPYKTLIQYVREGKVSYHRQGRRYVFDKDVLFLELQYLALEKKEEQKATVKEFSYPPKRRKRITYGKGVSYKEQLKKLVTG